MAKSLKLIALGLALAACSACSTIYPLESVAKRTSDQRMLNQDVRVDTASRDIAKVHSLAWGAYSVTFECEKQCPYTAEERTLVSKEIAEASFNAIDREMRKALETSARTLQEVDATVKSSAFASTTIQTDSYKSRVGHWLEHLGMSMNRNVTATARGLKYLNPNDIGWSGEESLLSLGQKLGVDGVLVGHLHVVVDTDDGAPKLTIHGPKVWIFSSRLAKAVAVAELKPSWRVEPVSTAAQSTLNWNGLDDVASGFSVRLSQAIQE